jgi:prevent-host-death family protein
MRISVTDATQRLDELVGLAEAGEEVVLTLEGREVVRLAPVKPRLTAEEKGALLDEIRASAAAKAKLINEICDSAAARATQSPSAARSQDFLYDEFGLPK